MNIRKLFIFISISAALTACVPQELTEEVGGNGAEGSGSSSYTGEGCSLELVIRGGDYGATRATTADSKDLKRIETNEFKRLMLMIIDDNGKLVAYRVLKQGAEDEDVPVYDYNTSSSTTTSIKFDNPAKPYVRKTPDPSEDEYNYLVKDPENPIPATGVNNFIVDNGTDPVYNEIHLEFIYTNPLHTETNADLSSERLTPGWYTILAIGNYYDDIFTGTGDFASAGYYGPADKTVKKILDNIYYEFNNAEKDGIDNFAPYKYDGSAWVPVGDQFQAGKDLINFAYKLAPNSKVDPINHGTETDKTDFMRSAEYDIIVSKVERFFLNPGQNNFDMELKRTTARVEFEIENFSDRKMKIAGLEFCDRFASGNTWLFPHTAMPLFDWTDNDRDIFRQKSSLSGIWGIGAMDPQGPSAVVKFDDTKTYAKGEAHTFFDCLIYETRPLASEAVPYWYSIGVIPEKAVGSGTFYSESDPMIGPTTTSATGLNQLDGLTIKNSGVSLQGTPAASSEEDKTLSILEKTFVSSILRDSTYVQYNNVYVLKSLRAGDTDKYFLYDNGGIVTNDVITSDAKDGIEAIMKKTNYKYYLWQWTGTKFMNCGSNNFMVIPDSYVATITTNSTGSSLSFEKFEGSASEKGVLIKNVNQNSSYTYYLNINGDPRIGTYWEPNDPGNNIGLYQISYKVISELKETTKIWGKGLWQNPLMAIEDGSSDAMPYYLNEINRNEHLKVRIGVSYNTFNQSLDFQVKSWKEKTNTFTFE